VSARAPAAASAGPFARQLPLEGCAVAICARIEEWLKHAASHTFDTAGAPLMPVREVMFPASPGGFLMMAASSLVHTKGVGCALHAAR
jgi:hypothetical protein